MAKEALEAVRQAEEQGKQLIAAASAKAKEILRQAELDAAEASDAIAKDTKGDIDRIHEMTKQKSNLALESILQVGEREAAEIRSMDASALDKAADELVERIVKANGNC